VTNCRAALSAASFNWRASFTRRSSKSVVCSEKTAATRRPRRREMPPKLRRDGPSGLATTGAAPSGLCRPRWGIVIDGTNP
jgi:hypothetical protein